MNRWIPRLLFLEVFLCGLAALRGILPGCASCGGGASAACCTGRRRGCSLIAIPELTPELLADLHPLTCPHDDAGMPDPLLQIRCVQATEVGVVRRVDGSAHGRGEAKLFVIRRAEISSFGRSDGVDTVAPQPAGEIEVHGILVEV